MSYQFPYSPHTVSQICDNAGLGGGYQVAFVAGGHDRIVPRVEQVSLVGVVASSLVGSVLHLTSQVAVPLADGFMCLLTNPGTLLFHDVNLGCVLKPLLLLSGHSEGWGLRG